jgi:hypothetical protein
MVLVHFLPRKAPLIAPILAALCLIALGLIVLLASSAYHLP